MHVAVGMIVMVLWFVLMVILCVATAVLVGTGRLPWTKNSSGQQRPGHRTRALRRGRSKLDDRPPR